MHKTEHSAHGSRPDLARCLGARVLNLERRQEDHVECLNAIAGHAPVQAVNQDSDVNGKPFDAFLNLALPVFLPRCRARAKANQALPLEQCSTVVPLEDADWCLDCKPPVVRRRVDRPL